MNICLYFSFYWPNYALGFFNYIFLTRNDIYEKYLKPYHVAKQSISKEYSKNITYTLSKITQSLEILPSLRYLVKIQWDGLYISQLKQILEW